MDAKVTKKRLSDFLAYEWIAIIFTAVAAVLILEAIFAFAAVKLSPGQSFDVYFDKNVSSQTELYEVLRDDVFSYDLIGGVGGEHASYGDDVLYARIDTYQPDVLVTDSVYEEGETVRAKTIIDNKKVYILTALYDDAKEYVDSFYDGEEINVERVKARFLERMKRDNRFRTDEKKEEGVLLEIGRIEKLKKDVYDFGKFLSVAPDELFFRYTRFEQVFENSTAEYYEENKSYYDREKAEGRENAIYGINAEYLLGGEHDPSEYFKLASEGSDSAKDVVILLFDQRYINGKENVLSYDAVSFFCKIIRLCTNYLA